MIDFHCHILPHMDDGAKNIEESIEMLKTLETQNVDTVCLTPHFYAEYDSIDSFLLRRKKAYEELTSNYSGNIKLLLGAEVAYYIGFSKKENIDELCLQGTNILLLELPFTKIHDTCMNEIIALSRMYTVVLAHIERYEGLLSKKQLKKLLESDVLVQVNASYFENLFTRIRGKKHIKADRIHFIGSDAHNMSSRKPNLDIVNKYLGKQINYLNKIEGSYLK